MPRGNLIWKLAGGLALCLVASTGCASTPDTASERDALEARAEATLQTMIAADPTLEPVLASAAGYVVFPQVREGGAIVGGARSVGVVYERGIPIGYATMSEGSVGLQLGGQTYSQLVVFRDQAALERLKTGNFDFTAGASATALSRGAGAQANFEGGSQVFFHGRGGLMAQADIGGQRITFEPSGG